MSRTGWLPPSDAAGSGASAWETTVAAPCAPGLSSALIPASIARLAAAWCPNWTPKNRVLSFARSAAAGFYPAFEGAWGAAPTSRFAKWLSTRIACDFRSRRKKLGEIDKVF